MTFSHWALIIFLVLLFIVPMIFSWGKADELKKHEDNRSVLDSLAPPSLSSTPEGDDSGGTTGTPWLTMFFAALASCAFLLIINWERIAPMLNDSMLDAGARGIIGGVVLSLLGLFAILTRKAWRSSNRGVRRLKLSLIALFAALAFWITIDAFGVLYTLIGLIAAGVIFWIVNGFRRTD